MKTIFDNCCVFAVRKRWFFILMYLAFLPLSNQGQNDSLEPSGKNNLAYKWGEVAMTCTANDTEKFRPRPTVTSRYLGLIWTAVYDAWSRYDDKANPLYLKKVQRRPER